MAVGSLWVGQHQHTDATQMHSAGHVCLAMQHNQTLFTEVAFIPLSASSLASGLHAKDTAGVRCLGRVLT
eukprot:m.10081 g.10081  ORF g.10081 m.10081 type:complete len:70 (+) comp7203_c0_seq1:103-312(+)